MPDVSLHPDQSRTVLPVHCTTVYAGYTAAHPIYSAASRLDGSTSTVIVPSLHTDRGDLGRAVVGAEAWSVSPTLQLHELYSGVHGWGEGRGDAACSPDSVA